MVSKRCVQQKRNKQGDRERPKGRNVVTYMHAKWSSLSLPRCTKIHLGAGEIAEPAKALATNSDDLSSIPRTYTVEGENQLPQVVL